jgi:hypothetical protein
MNNKLRKQLEASSGAGEAFVGTDAGGWEHAAQGRQHQVTATWGEHPAWSTARKADRVLLKSNCKQYGEGLIQAK